ncbi:MAG TPA: dihydrolipoamide acetyltransferase family protein [Anaerolineales bacterium]|nr:dihydrolipoamide acetyltransferase family protein [Anaerolineales bacterium]
MAHTVVMPRFGATMEEGTINSWSVKEGSAVSKGDVLGEIAIEKLTNELLAEQDGVVLKLLADEGATVACGEPILILGAAGEKLEEGAAPVHSAAGTPAPRAVQNAALSQASQEGTEQRAFGGYRESPPITAKALKLAEELHVDYHFARGTGRLGMITREDIRAAHAAGRTPAAGARSAPGAETKKMTMMQLSVADAMDASLRSTAQTTISMDMDATALVRSYQLHKDEFRQRGIRLTYTAILVKVAALALVEHRAFRTVIEGANLATRGEINIGIAVDVSEGLIVPNIKNANEKRLSQIALELEDLSERAKRNALTADELSAGTFTISNLGMFGIKYFTPILKPGESGILGVGTVREEVQAQNGGIFVRPVMNLSLTHDHRVVNGAPAARFLQTIQQMMNGCESLFADQG